MLLSGGPCMLSAESIARLRREVTATVVADGPLLDQLRQEIRPLQNCTRRLHPRTATAVSIVATDGGNNSLYFDPFLIQLVRVVDSSSNEYCLEVIGGSGNLDSISSRQLGDCDHPPTALGELMAYLTVTRVQDLSPMIRSDADGRPLSPGWTRAYRELLEWATLFRLVREKDFGSDTLVVFDGLLRSKIFAHNLFARFREGLQEGISRQRRERNRRIYVVGLAKRSKVITRYRLAMALEDVMRGGYPCFVEIPRELEEKAYRHVQYARGDDWVAPDSQGKNTQVAGKMFFVKFGSRATDPIWPVDVLQSQLAEAHIVLGHLLADAENGFPIPFYPRSLQEAHQQAALTDFDLVVLQDLVFDSIRSAVNSNGAELDVLRLQDQTFHNRLLERE